MSLLESLYRVFSEGNFYSWTGTSTKRCAFPAAWVLQQEEGLRKEEREGQFFSKIWRGRRKQRRIFPRKMALSFKIGVYWKEEQWKKDFEMLRMGAQEFLKKEFWRSRKGRRDSLTPIWGLERCVPVCERNCCYCCWLIVCLMSKCRAIMRQFQPLMLNNFMFSARFRVIKGDMSRNKVAIACKTKEMSVFGWWHAQYVRHRIMYSDICTMGTLEMNIFAMKNVTSELEYLHTLSDLATQKG